MTAQDSAEPPYGKRVMVDIIDNTARNDPTRPWFLVPRSSSPQGGWKPITYADGANAINRLAHIITETSGRPAKGSFPTLAYVGPNDVRYFIFTFGCIKAGYKALFISPRNSHEGQMNLFEKTDCDTIWFDAAFRNVVQPWLQERDMRSVVATPPDEWFPEERVPHFPYDTPFEQARREPLVVLHTSGTTGLPKPVVAPQGMLSVSDAYHNVPEWHGTYPIFRAWGEMTSVFFIPMPLFHAAGLYLAIMMSLFWDSAIALGIPEKPLSSDLVLECLDNLEADAVVLPPVLLEEMSQSKESMGTLSKLNIVAFGGGKLAEEAGDRLVEHGVALDNIISCTEFAAFPLYWQPNRKMWQWYVINSDIFGCDWRQSKEDPEVYEQFIVRKGEDPGMQGFFHTFPELDEYGTKDLYRKHPTLPDHWLYVGRADDIIVFSNGEKLNPVTMEGIIMGHPDVIGAMVVGSNKFQPALIVEPKCHPASKDEEQSFIDKVWPNVVKANEETVAHGQIGRNFIALSKPERPFKRSGKGTIQRAATVAQYADHIDEIYENAGQIAVSDVVKMELSTEEALIGSVTDIFRAAAVAAPLDPDTDFFQSGVDSMQVINASRLLRASLESAGVHVSADALATRVIYGNPTPRKLARYLFSVVKCEQNGVGQDGEDEVSAMRAQIERYTRDLPATRTDKARTTDESQTVLLTGSTGALGSYLLDFLCSSPRVARVICLNRAENGRERQTSVSSGRGLATDFREVDFLHADLGRDNLGLGRADYSRLQNEVDRVIHNQWPVNFNLAVESFESHIRGVRHLVDFSAGARKNVPITFISSIGTLDGWNEPHPVPERCLDNLTISSTGYGRSKLVSSLILDKVTEASGIPSEIIRVGQIAGPLGEKGMWNRQEWLPSIVASSLYLETLPADLGIMNTVDWVPIEQIAQTILEVAGIASEIAPEDIHGYFHGVNPSTTTWSALAPAVKDFYGGRIKRLVPFAEWVRALEETQATIEDVSRNPAVKLLDTYRAWNAAQGGFDMETTRTKRYSRTMREMEAVSPKLMKHWCSQWGF